MQSIQQKAERLSCSIWLVCDMLCECILSNFLSKCCKLNVNSTNDVILFALKLVLFGGRNVLEHRVEIHIMMKYNFPFIKERHQGQY